MKPNINSAVIVVTAMLLGLSMALNAACGNRKRPLPINNLQPAPTALPPTAVIKATETVPLPIPILTETALPTASPTPTPWPEVRLFAPDHLRGNVAAAIQQMESAGSTWNWRLVDAGEAADINLMGGEAGIPAGRRAVALTVPFTVEWERVASAEAEDILANGRQSIVAMDWAEITPRRKALRVDGLLPSEPGYPLLRPWSLIASAEFQPAATELGRTLREFISQDTVIHLSAVGDLMLDRALGYAINNGDPSYPFSAVAAELEQAELTVGNLESALGNRGQAAAKSYTFRAPPSAADSFAGAGFDVLTLANNHALDYGPEALAQAMALLAERGIATVGAGIDEASAREPVILDRMGLRVAFLGYVDVPVEVSGFDTQDWSATESTPGMAWADLDHIGQDVAAARQEADVVVVLLHSGYEYVYPPSPAQEAAARKAVDAGAHLVIGHHAHVLQGVEFRDESVIAYGLGNFAFEIDGDPATAILNVWLDAGGVRQIEFIPAVIQAGGQPRIASADEAARIRRTIYYWTDLLSGAP